LFARFLLGNIVRDRVLLNEPLVIIVGNESEHTGSILAEAHTRNIDVQASIQKASVRRMGVTEGNHFGINSRIRRSDGFSVTAGRTNTIRNAAG
jgi:hypothetical protein